MKFSVIVPVYNCENSLFKCIESILGQEFNDFEVIIVNDGSSDSSEEICKRFIAKDSRVKYFYQKNSGVSSARNLGIENAVGEWIVFCDSDDYVGPYFLRDFFCNISEDTEIICQGFYCFNWQNIQDQYVGSKIKRKISGIDLLGEEIVQQLKDGYLGYVWCKAFKREIIIKNCIRFPIDIHFMEDLLFVSNYLKNVKSILVLYSSNYFYNFTPVGKEFLTSNPYDLLIVVYKNVLAINSDSNFKYEIRLYYAEAIIELFLSGRYNLTNEMLIDYYRQFSDVVFNIVPRSFKVRVFKYFAIKDNRSYNFKLIKIIRCAVVLGKLARIWK